MPKFKVWDEMNGDEDHAADCEWHRFSVSHGEPVATAGGEPGSATVDALTETVRQQGKQVESLRRALLAALTGDTPEPGDSVTQAWWKCIAELRAGRARISELERSLSVAEDGIRAIAFAFENDPEFDNLGKVDIDELVARAVMRLRARISELEAQLGEERKKAERWADAYGRETKCVEQRDGQLLSLQQRLAIALRMVDDATHAPASWDALLGAAENLLGANERLASVRDSLRERVAAWEATREDGLHCAAIVARDYAGTSIADAASDYLDSLPSPEPAAPVEAPQPRASGPDLVADFQREAPAALSHVESRDDLLAEQPKAWVPKVGERVIVKPIASEYADCTGKVRFVYEKHARVTLDAAPGALAIVAPSFAFDQLEPEPAEHPQAEAPVLDVERALKSALDGFREVHGSFDAGLARDKFAAIIRALGGQT